MALARSAARTWIHTASKMMRNRLIGGLQLPLRRRYHIEVVIPNIAKSTAEGPVWLNESKQLLFTDALDGDIHLWDSRTGKIDTVHYDTFATFCIPHRHGGFVAGVGQSVLHFYWHDHHNYTTLASVDQGKPTRLNDAKCDKFGRLIFGTMGLEKRPAVPVMEQGSLFSLTTESQVKTWDSGLHIGNSPAFSPDYKTLYLSESIGGIIYAYDYDHDTGSISHRRVLSYLPHTEYGVLDRMTVDTDGNLWAAYYLGGHVTQIDTRSGEVIREVRLPCPTLTSLIFGGENYDELYVTSSSYEQDLSENPHAGSIFRITGLGVRGLPPNYFNGRLPQNTKKRSP